MMNKVNGAVLEELSSKGLSVEEAKRRVEASYNGGS